MSYLSMTTELTGVAPRMPYDYARTIVNRALLETYRMSMWSCLTFEANWTTPSWVTTGTVAVTQGSNSVVFDAAAGAAINSIGLVPSPVTKRQFRIGVGTIYNIWAWDNATFTATLDRPYQEVTAAASAYSILQCYYASPVQDFKGWASIRDMVNYNDLYYTNSRAWIDLRDPQRTWYQIPTQVVFYQNDLNPASSTYGYPMFEIWGPPTYQLTYQLYGYRKGLPLSAPADELPSCLGEDCIMAKARQYAYEWSEANPQPGLRSANLVTLKRDADGDFNRLYRQYRMQDREMQDAFHTKFRRSRAYPSGDGTYNTITGIASTS